MMSRDRRESSAATSRRCVAAIVFLSVIYLAFLIAWFEFGFDSMVSLIALPGSALATIAAVAGIAAIGRTN